MSTDNSNLFGQSYSEILSKVIGDSAAKFQMIYPYMAWWWPTAPSGQIDANAFNFANQVPLWSAIGSFAPTDATLFSSYRQVLQQVNLSVSPSQQQQATDAHNDLITAENQYQTDLTARNTAWTTMKNNLPPDVPAPDFNTWESQSGWAGTLLGDSQAVTKKQETYNNIVAQQNPEYTAATAALSAPDKGTFKPGWTQMLQAGGNLVPVPSYSIGTSGQDWVALLSKGTNSSTLTLDASKSTYDFSHSWAGGNASFDRVFWAINAGGSWDSMDLSESDQSVKATITLKASTLVPVTPAGEWYDSGYLRKLGSDPNAFNTPFTPTGGSSPVFGEKGLLPARITQLVVGYQPSFEITMSQSTFDQHKDKFNASLGIRIGPFSFGGSGGHETNKWTKAASGTTFKGASTATYPFIMGVTVANPGLGT